MSFTYNISIGILTTETNATFVPIILNLVSKGTRKKHNIIYLLCRGGWKYMG